METSNFMQVLEQSHEEKMKMYMKLPKKQLAKMLIECNKQLDFMLKNNPINYTMGENSQFNLTHNDEK